MVHVSITPYAKTQGDIKHNGFKLLGEFWSRIWKLSSLAEEWVLFVRGLLSSVSHLPRISVECTMLYTYEQPFIFIWLTPIEQYNTDSHFELPKTNLCTSPC